MTDRILVYQKDVPSRSDNKNTLLFTILRRNKNSELEILNLMHCFILIRLLVKL